MVYLPMDEMLKKSDSIYMLVMLACKRAKELNEGATPMVKNTSQKWTTMALEEIRTNKISYKQGKKT